MYNLDLLNKDEDIETTVAVAIPDECQGCLWRSPDACRNCKAEAAEEED